MPNILQKVGPPSVELDKLVDKMSEFYSLEENLEVYRPKEVFFLVIMDLSNPMLAIYCVMHALKFCAYLKC